ncbi:molecular chaperone [Tessaracoccus sp. MC1756]|uniref:TorD/DmsD family molecular chaperone n=1 Tax=Tessaracoccus sp. MC1756 TaxID=2760311 RepID=UPI00160380B6|nr:molecular chaperone TorD family protein [Tessaracoccus sp. MC1756]MBB1509660.1 molecular chaperone TorD family protein [Tessaracoccus sp. MC1756]
MDAEDLDRRSASLTVISRLLLAPPSEDALRQLRDPDLLAEWPTPEGADEGLRLLARSAESVEEVRIDHQRLFGGAGPAKANPFESVHRSREGLKFEAETLQVRAAYRRLGLQAPLLHKEPDDHIGLELEFVATAYQRAAELLDEGEEADEVLAVAQDFIRDHLQQWVPQLFDLVVERAETDFYRGVGHLGGALLRTLG